MTARKERCMCCGRVVAVRFSVQNKGLGAGKPRVRHKCPHGEWCVAGKLITGFNMPQCPRCMAERRAENEAQGDQR